MNSGSLLHSSSLKIILAVCIGHAMLIAWMMSSMTKHSPESPAILYGQLLERESTSTDKTVSMPSKPSQKVTHQPNMPSIEHSQGMESNKQLAVPPAMNVSAPITLPSANDPAFNNPKPPYPIVSRENGEQGRVWLSLCVSEHGSVSRLQLAQSSGHPALDRSAINTVTHWKFHPARQNGAAIPHCYRLPIVFVLA